KVELGARGWAAVTTESRHTGARHGRDGPVGIYLANPVVLVIGDEEVALTVHGNPRRLAECGARGRATVPTGAPLAGARDRSDGAVPADLANPLVIGLAEIRICDEEVALAVHGHPLRGRELGAARRAAIAEESKCENGAVGADHPETDA